MNIFYYLEKPETRLCVTRDLKALGGECDFTMAVYEKTWTCAYVLLKEEMQAGSKWKKNNIGIFFLSSKCHHYCVGVTAVHCPWVPHMWGMNTWVQAQSAEGAGMSSSGILSHLHTFACSLQGHGFDLSSSFPLTFAGSNQAINHNLWCSKHVHFKETFAFVEQSRPSLRATLDSNSEALFVWRTGRFTFKESMVINGFAHLTSTALISLQSRYQWLVFLMPVNPKMSLRVKYDNDELVLTLKVTRNVKNADQHASRML